MKYDLLRGGGGIGVRYFAFSESRSEQSEGAGTYTNMCTLDMDDCAAGYYTIRISGLCAHSNTSYFTDCRVRIDDTTTVSTCRVGDSTYSNNGWQPFNLIVRVELTEGDHEIDLDIKTESSSYTSYVQNIGMIAYRSEEGGGGNIDLVGDSDSYGENSTTSTSYTEADSLSLTDVPAGDYFVFVKGEWGVDYSSYYVGLRIQLDDTDTLFEDNLENTVNYVNYSVLNCFVHIDRVSLDGNHDIDIDFLAESGIRTVYFNNIAIAVFKAGP